MPPKERWMFRCLYKMNNGDVHYTAAFDILEQGVDKSLGKDKCAELVLDNMVFTLDDIKRKFLKFPNGHRVSVGNISSISIQEWLR